MLKLENYFFKYLKYVMLGISVYWLLSSIIWLTTISLTASLCFLLLLVFLLAFWQQGIILRLRRVYRWAVSHKYLLLVGALLFQLILLISASMMIRSDAAVVFKGAVEQLDAQAISNYLTRNPNNLFLFLYERFIYRLFSDYSIWVLQAINLLAVHLTAFLFYRSGKVFFSQAIADKVFIFYLLLISLTPKFMAMYTDILVLPLLALQFYLALDTYDCHKREDLKIWKILLMGAVTGLAIALRPTAAIVMIALFAVLFLKRVWKFFLLTISLFLLGFGASYGWLIYVKENQTEVVLSSNKDLEKNLLTFINLGLTFSGTDQDDMQEGLADYIAPENREEYNNGRFADNIQKAEIKRRLKDYTPWTFLLHILYKQYLTTGQGNLNWIYKDAWLEKTAYMSPLAEMTKNHSLADFFRSYFIYRNQGRYDYYDFFIQTVWILLALGLVLFFKKKEADDQEKILTLALFGSLLFLQIFEGGKSRYLIQFLPQILFLTALGWDNWLRKAHCKRPMSRP